MSYMLEVAQILGLKLGEEFYGDGYDGVYKWTLFRLTENGLEFQDQRCSDEPWQEDNGSKLRLFLAGEFGVYKKPYIPKLYEFYWCCRKDSVSCKHNTGTSHNIYDIKVGNCYLTEKEAKAHEQEWKNFFSSTERIFWEEQA